MAFLKTGFGSEYNLSVRGHGVWLRAPAMADYVKWAELRALSRDHLRPWEPQWARDELTRSAFRRRLRHYAREAREDHGYAFVILRSADDTLVGGLTVSNVRRGVSQSASLGYWLGQGPYDRCGPSCGQVLFRGPWSAPGGSRVPAGEHALDTRAPAFRFHP